MFYPRTIGRRKNWGITSRVSPGANPFILTLLVLLMLILLSPEGTQTTLANDSLSKEAASSLAPYPSSPVIQSVSFDRSSHNRLARGSDNWPITWADDGHQYASWGDGGGFGGTSSDGRVSLGVARIEGDGDRYQGFNAWGGKNPENRATFGGKSCGIISVNGVLYMWVSPGSTPRTYQEARLYRSTNHGASWQGASWRFFDDEGIILPTILQFGQDYAGARDNYVYHYAAGLADSSGHVIQKPGEIYLFRVHKDQIFSPKSSYQFFNGWDSSGNPIWSNNINNKKPVFEDPDGVGPKVAVSYNTGLGRYLLTTEHTESGKGNLGIFDAPEPWGPWTVVAYMNHSDNTEFGHGDSAMPDTTFFWNFSNKWLSTDGLDFTLIFTGTGANDSWNTIRGRFTLAPTTPPSPTPTPTPPLTPIPSTLLPGRIEAEAYKAGGEGLGYHDTTSGNSGGAYRSDDVDIQVATDAGGGYNVGWIRQGEWLAFDVQVAQAGQYDFIARVASAREGAKSLHVEVDGVDVSGPLSFTDASGWQSWLDVAAKGINLAAGPHQLRIVMDTDSFNVNYVDVLPSANQAPSATIASPGEGASFLTTDTINFIGSATDFEDGDLTPSLVWTSSLNGQLGTGGSVQASLSAGEHVIILMAADSQGASDSKAVNISVVNLIYGDANQDGEFTGDDIYLVVDWVIGRTPMPQAGTPAFMAADVDGDGKITASDIGLMLDRLLGNLDEFPVEL